MVELLRTDLVFIALEGGTMALLVAKFTTSIIQILGRWHSDKIFQYLHLKAKPIMKQFAVKIFNTNCISAPSQLVPCNEIISSLPATPLSHAKYVNRQGLSLRQYSDHVHRLNHGYELIIPTKPTHNWGFLEIFSY